MSTQKIDDKLRNEIERLERSGGPAQRLPVIIEHGVSGGPPREGDRKALEEQVRTAQQPLLKRLADMGISDVQQMTLANAVSAELSPAQIREIAAEPAVKRVIWNIAERVTL